jgi:hypothetical protein
MPGIAMGWVDQVTAAPEMRRAIENPDAEARKRLITSGERTADQRQKDPLVHSQAGDQCY